VSSPRRRGLHALALGAAVALAISVAFAAIPGVGVAASAVGGGIAAAVGATVGLWAVLLIALPALVIAYVFLGPVGFIPATANVFGPALFASIGLSRDWRWRRTALVAALPGLALAVLLLAFHGRIAPVVENALREAVDRGLDWTALIGRSQGEIERTRELITGFIKWAVRLLPAAQALGALALGALVTVVGSYTLTRTGDPRRVVPSSTSWRTPIWLAVLVVVALVARKFSPNDPQALVLENVLAVAGGYTVVVGTVVFVCVARRLIPWWLPRLLLYVGVIFTGRWGLIGLSVLGLLDPWTKLRSRIEPDKKK
jgi:hypothetical protein